MPPDCFAQLCLAVTSCPERCGGSSAQPPRWLRRKRRIYTDGEVPRRRACTGIVCYAYLSRGQEWSAVRGLCIPSVGRRRWVWLSGRCSRTGSPCELLGGPRVVRLGSSLGVDCCFLIVLVDFVLPSCNLHASGAGPEGGGTGTETEHWVQLCSSSCPWHALYSLGYD